MTSPTQFLLKFLRLIESMVGPKYDFFGLILVTNHKKTFLKLVSTPDTQT